MTDQVGLSALCGNGFIVGGACGILSISGLVSGVRKLNRFIYVVAVNAVCRF